MAGGASCHRTFDWMIGYCADAPDPLEELRHLIWEFYLQKFDCDNFSENDTQGCAR